MRSPQTGNVRALARPNLLFPPALPFLMAMCFLALAALLLPGCDSRRDASAADGAASSGISSGARQDVTVAVLQPQRIVVATELAGRVSAYGVSDVRPQVGGIIRERLFTEGADVKAGDVLYRIDPAPYRADLASAEANLAKAEANVTPAALKLRRFKDLVRVNAVSKQEYDDAEAAYKQALAEVGVTRADVDSARIRLAYTEVTSPISGRIGRSLATPGALVTEHQADPLATVQRMDLVYVDVTQSSAVALRLKRSLETGRLKAVDKGRAAVRLRFEDGTEYAETGALQFADVSVDEGTGAVALRAIFPNPKGELLPGMYVRAVLTEGVDEEALLLPQPALLRDAGGNATVYVVDAEGRAQRRAVSLGRTCGPNWIVLDGLAAGERVVVAGLQKVRPGTAVNILDTADAASPAALAASGLPALSRAPVTTAE